ncbi:unnamed protein product, partial [Phaeothamnion confervicola]
AESDNRSRSPGTRSPTKLTSVSPRKAPGGSSATSASSRATTAASLLPCSAAISAAPEVPKAFPAVPQVFGTLGPVIGEVTGTTATLLIETSAPTQLTCFLTAQKVGRGWIHHTGGGAGFAGRLGRSDGGGTSGKTGGNTAAADAESPDQSDNSTATVTEDSATTGTGTTDGGGSGGGRRTGGRHAAAAALLDETEVVSVPVTVEDGHVPVVFTASGLRRGCRYVVSFDPLANAASFQGTFRTRDSRPFCLRIAAVGGGARPFGFLDGSAAGGDSLPFAAMSGPSAWRRPAAAAAAVAAAADTDAIVARGQDGLLAAEAAE